MPYDRPMKPCEMLCYLLVASGLAACSSQQMYEALQLRNRNECEKLAEPDRMKCLEATNKRYEDYQRDREQAAKN